VGVGSHIRVENNYFDNVNRPWANYYEGKDYPSGEIGQNSSNVFNNATIPTWAKNNYATVFKPPYSYKMDDAKDIPTLVKTYAGTRNPYPPKKK
jgi:pectate lyase